jgi:hypothetical protein
MVVVNKHDHETSKQAPLCDDGHEGAESSLSLRGSRHAVRERGSGDDRSCNGVLRELRTANAGDILGARASHASCAIAMTISSAPLLSTHAPAQPRPTLLCVPNQQNLLADHAS